MTVSTTLSDFPRLGISLQGIKHFIEHFKEKSFAEKTTEEVCKEFIIPNTHNVSYCEQLFLDQSPYVGTATIFISHAWKYTFLKVIRTLEYWLQTYHSTRPKREKGTNVDSEGTTSKSSSTGAGDTTTENGSTIYLWFDLFSNSQHGTRTKDFTWWTSCFAENIKDIGHTLLVLDWQDRIPLSRMWCGWELACSAKLQLDIAMDWVEEQSFVRELVYEYDNVVKKMFKIDLEKAETENSCDRENIIQAIKTTSSFQDTNQKVIGKLKDWMITIANKKVTQMNAEERNKLLELSALQNNLGRLYHDQGNYEAAETFYQKALYGRIEKLGIKHRTTLTSISNLGELYHSQRNYEEAQKYLELAYKIRRKILGPMDHDTLKSMNDLAVVYKDMRMYEEAEPLYKEALASRLKKLGPDDRDTLESMNNFGVFYKSKENFTKAEDYYRMAMEGRKKNFGDKDRDTLTSMNNLALLYHSRRNYEAAVEVYEKVVDGRREVLGDRHPLTLTSIATLAVFYKDLRKYDKAKSLYEEALIGLCEKKGVDHDDTIKTYQHYAVLLRIPHPVTETSRNTVNETVINFETLKAREAITKCMD